MAGKRGGGFQRVNHSTTVNLDEIPDAGWLNGIDPSNPGSFGAAGGTPDIAAGNNLIGSGSARVMQLGLKILF